MNREDEHIDIRHRLLKLPKVKAGADFENELLRRINLAETGKEPAAQRDGFFSLLFGKKSMVWTVPAMSLTVVAIVVFGWYYIFNGKGLVTNKQDSSPVVTQQSGETPAPPPSSVTKKDENIAGREITNDMEIGKDSKLKKTESKTGYNETYIESTTIDKNKSVDEGKSLYKPEKKEEFMQKSVPEDRKDSERYKTEDVRSETPKESMKKSGDMEKKIVSPMLKETDKVSKGDFEESDNTGKVNTAKDSTKVSKKKKANNEKEITKDVLETLSKKIKDNK